MYYRNEKNNLQGGMYAVIIFNSSTVLEDNKEMFI